MSEAEFEAYMRFTLAHYAEEMAGVTEYTLEEAHVLAGEQIRRLLPEGRHTPGHRLHHVLDEAGTRTGYLWYAENRDDDPPRLYIYDIRLEPASRGQGLGTRLLRWLEDRARSLGLPAIGLSVVRHNTGAIRLYERLGYESEVVSDSGRRMIKRLAPR